jgi:hypothetical protein
MLTSVLFLKAEQVGPGINDWDVYLSGKLFYS